MGRKINFAEKPKKGPGRKAKKQKDPSFPASLTKGADDEAKKLSHRQKTRIKKRTENQILKRKVNEEKSQISKKAKKNSHETNGHKLDNSAIEQTRAKYAKAVKKAKDSLPTSDQSSEEEYDSEESLPDDGPKMRDLLSSDEEGNDSGDGEASSKLKEMMDSDDDEDFDGDQDSSDEDDDDKSSMLPIERIGQKMKKKKEQLDRMADDELQDQAANREKFEFPSETQDAPTNLQDVHMRIKEIIGVLADFTVNRDPNHSRAEYMDLLKKDLCLYYSYNEFFMDQLIKIFSPNELLDFLEASEVQRPLTIRTNSLKTRRRDLAQALINRGVNLDPVGKWSKEGLVVYSSQVPLGATPEYLAGQYMIQGASSMLPVISLAPEENERILDLCAAPGGKSSHIAALMKNTGILFANDVNKDRLQAVVGNFHRLGIQNAIVTNIDGSKYREVMTGFDRVLLDAPCTGSGVISKDASVKTTKTETDIQRCYNLQRKLLLTAIDCATANSKTGGIIVYSTCSILPQENEWVIDYALRKRNVRLVATGLDFGSEGFVNFAGQKYHPSMKLTRRYYPHSFNMDGFFVAKLQKFSDSIPTNNQADEDEEEEVEDTTEQDEKLPKKIDKRDWYYKDIIEKRKKQREDPNHVLKVFEKPSKSKKSNAPGKEVAADNAALNIKTPKAKKRMSLPHVDVVETDLTVKSAKKQKKLKRLSLPGAIGARKIKT
ncbi:uncharacterized protein LOC129757990 [Uranotaenia lowii]|uniref:uncharacterized protein LOC129757990 n=1 Tax=Uranotaenia lowii TaxID=190385 RepID=UPI0024791947|nr:uncharacterized protein LOC129757990 [Uranotaenia lowii]